MTEDFVNYYELLEASQTASGETLERSFRYLAKTMHPDHSEECDMRRFTKLVEAYETLRDPDTRAAYDIKFAQHVKQKEELISDAGCADRDSADRHKMLSLLYAKRRQDMKQPGIGGNTLQDLLKTTSNVIEFHLWFFRQKGWIAREENGLLAITAEGVDKIEATVQLKAQSLFKRITQEGDKVEHQQPESDQTELAHV